MTILYVDDDSDDREIFGAAIRAINPGVVYNDFDDGTKIISFLGAGISQPDYIFIDINMPRMNGYECAHEIISVYGIERSRIVMYSTTFSGTDIDKFTRMGVQMIQKATSFDLLIKNLRALLAESQSVTAG